MIAAPLIAFAAMLQQPAPPWIVGTWVWAQEGEPAPIAACESGLRITYAAEGTYRFLGEAGDWRLDGDQLTEIAREVSPDHWRPNAGDEIGQPWTARIERLEAGRFVKHYQAGNRLVFHRCPVVITSNQREE